MTSESANIKLIEIKGPEVYLQKRKEMLKQFGSLGPADACILQHVKEGTFLSKKEQRCSLWFFQGLNVYPQNLSLLLKDWAHKQARTNPKDKLVKGLFAIYDVFEQEDCVVQINMPGSLKIVRTGQKSKEVLLNDSIDSMYVSSVLRTIYEQNLEWGRYYDIFEGDKPIQQFRQLLQAFFRLVKERDIYINDEYQQKAVVRGSHSCSLLYELILRKRIAHHALDFYTDYIKNHTEEFWQCPKLVILYAELLTLDQKFYKSLRVTTLLAERYNHDPLITYYQARYLTKLNMNREAMKLLQTLKQYNQAEIWLLMAEVQISLNKFSEALLCLNFVSKLLRPLQKPVTTGLYRNFEQLGRIKKMEQHQDLECFPRFHMQARQPIIIGEKEKLDPKLKVLPHTAYWKLQPYEQQVFDRLLLIKQNIEKPKFQQLIQNTFHTTIKEYPHVNFKLGLSKSNLKKSHESESDEGQGEQHSTQVPQFLVDKQQRQQQAPTAVQPHRNLSIIPEIESFVQNSVFEQKKKQELQQHHNNKHILHQRLMKLIKAVFHQTPVEDAQSKGNYNSVLPYYNKLRKCLVSNYIYRQMMHIFAETQNYRSVIILVAELLNQLEAAGVRKIDKLPYWVEPYIYDIISQKGLSHLNEQIEKLKFYDEAIIDCIKRAGSWRLQGVDY